jgi:hypothetical protein
LQESINAGYKISYQETHLRFDHHGSWSTSSDENHKIPPSSRTTQKLGHANDAKENFLNNKLFLSELPSRKKNYMSCKALYIQFWKTPHLKYDE